MDLSAAFDTIDHMILVDLLLRDLGVDDRELSWFKSYLSGRKQRVAIDQQQSRDFDLVCLREAVLGQYFLSSTPRVCSIL